ncbi:hypothetical protein SAMN05444360_109187 [Chryseobacterium carnipullorum]|uniref:Uncharacterized protein n=2 Tax=Chryseobacterium group TaxID=2782232 RepID=A0A085B5R9_9FLAO|nr:hypothetical protein IO89_20400 [Epilithonimonas lactis]SER14195.1 hypothetical protein SAMN04488097_4010 [Epilithonimonas lactis]SHM25377.1 hypothetical protein SAMN05444360_109187 [Chryseobacterium carnipullorum]
MRTTIFSILAIFFVVIIFIFYIDSGVNNDKFIIQDIKAGFDGIVLKKVSVRSNDLLTHIKIKSKTKDTLVFIGQNINNIKMDDSIYKPAGTPFLFIKSRRQTKRINYSLIPSRLLYSDDFEASWKDSCKTTWKHIVQQ